MNGKISKPLPKALSFERLQLLQVSCQSIHSHQSRGCRVLLGHLDRPFFQGLLLYPQIIEIAQVVLQYSQLFDETGYALPFTQTAEKLQQIP